MIKNYLLVTLRNMMRNKVYSLINIVGLAIGLTACFLIYQFVRFELSYDKFNSNAASIYRVSSELLQDSTHIGMTVTNAPALGPALKAEFPEVTEFTRLVKTSLFTSSLTSFFVNSLEFSCQKQGGDLVAFNEERVYFADAPFLTMFTFPLSAGTPTTALQEPNSVVISETMARKYFGTEQALGKEMRLNREMVLTVTGVIKDVPQNSHLQFDILLSFSTLMKTFGNGYDVWTWGVFYNYISLAPGTDPAALQDKLPAFMKKYLGQMNEGEYHMRFYLQPISDIHLRSNSGSEQSANGDERTVYFLSILAVFILIVAWINYINLSTAKALERSKEVGLRKVVGATRKQLIIQFLFDAAFINFLAVVVAALLVIVSWSYFERMIGKNIASVLYHDNFGGANQWLVALLILLAGVLIVGTYPALVLSSFNPAQVLKGKFFKSLSGSFLRKLMISFQYVLAILLIAGAITIYKQLFFMRSQDPGYAKDQIVILEAPAVYDSTTDDRVEFFKNEMLQLPGVKNITASADIPGRRMVENSPISRMNATDNNQPFETSISSIDPNFFSTYQIKLLEGRLFNENEKMNFRARSKDDVTRILVNEEFVKRMGVKDPKEVLHVKMVFWWGPEQRFAEIIGVTADHHQESFKQDLQAIMYMQPQWTAWKYFSVNINPNNFNRDVESIRTAYSKAFPDNSFSYFFLDDFFDHQYQADQQFGTIFNVFTLLAIIITCLGLLGLSIFSVTQRTKEIGIRKVLGASSAIILFLFSKDFVRILLISYIIAAPVIYYAGNNWLENFNFRISVGWQIFLLPPALLLLITLFTIGIISLRKAMANPVHALRHE
jgi:putative ABC transport system permease protein